ncbi:MAG TPA: hypothetical protein VIA06_09890 [Candidatus Dormibacteraeota bacterium]|jgi:hypothetical protein|nr:hypothetical protein [Candidatus Dormibacteraeota bacterium]
MGEQSRRIAVALAVAVAVVVATVSLSSVAAGAWPAPRGDGFIRVCGTQLCLQGRPFVIHGASAYGQYADPVQEVALARRAHLDVIELVEFDTQYHVLSDTMSAATWDRLDCFIAVAGAAGLHVVLNLSEYGQSLAAAGQPPTAVDWESYLRFIADRINTVTGVRYADDPAIAMVELYGEIDAPDFGVPTAGTTAQMTAYFHRSLAEWHALAPNILASTGGFSYINYPDSQSGIDWQQIVSDPLDTVCDVEVNSSADRDVSVPELSSYCRGLGKPWFLAAWSSCYNDQPWGSADIDDWPSDTAMAAHAEDMEEIAADRDVTPPGPAMAPVGTDFWNLGDTPVVEGTCDLGPQFPLTFDVVRRAGAGLAG